MSKRFTVYCMCGWKGRRVYGDECACYDMCYCSRWGNCPKCNSRVGRISPAQINRQIAEAEKWLSSPEGQETLARQALAKI